MRLHRYRAGPPAAAFALAVSACIAGGAQAQVAVVSSGHQVQIIEAGGAQETPQFPDSSGASIPFTTNTFNKGSLQTAVTGAFSYSGDTATRQLNMDTNLGIQRQLNPEKGTTSVAGHNQMDLADILTYTTTSTAAAPQEVFVHGQLFVSNRIRGVNNGQDFAFEDTAFSLDGNLNATFGGSGFNLATAATPLNCHFGSGTGCDISSVQPIDFTIGLTLGQAQDVDFQLLDSFNLAMTDNSGGHMNLFMTVGDASSLTFGDTFTVTDAAGGSVCGAVIGSASGANWGTTSACPVGGGGGAGGVPEPATWALMIAGFGGAGAMLRRRRALVA